MKIRSLNHSTYQHQYHIVWGTKYRRKVLKDYVKPELIKIMYETAKKYPMMYIQAINVDNDHVHIQLEISPNISVSRAVQILKVYSSKYLKSKFKFIKRIYMEGGSMWSIGYFSSTIGLNEETIRKYIEYQGRKDVPNDQLNFEFS